MADGHHFKNRYIVIFQWKIIRFSWNFVHNSRFWTGRTPCDQKWKVALDRLRVRQNVFLVYLIIYLLNISNLLTYALWHILLCHILYFCASHISMFSPSYGWSPTYGYLYVGTFLRVISSIHLHVGIWVLPYVWACVGVGIWAGLKCVGGSRSPNSLLLTLINVKKLP